MAKYKLTDKDDFHHEYKEALLKVVNSTQTPDDVMKEMIDHGLIEEVKEEKPIEFIITREYDPVVDKGYYEVKVLVDELTEAEALRTRLEKAMEYLNLLEKDYEFNIRTKEIRKKDTNQDEQKD